MMAKGGVSYGSSSPFVPAVPGIPGRRTKASRELPYEVHLTVGGDQAVTMTLTSTLSSSSRSRCSVSAGSEPARSVTA